MTKREIARGAVKVTQASRSTLAGVPAAPLCETPILMGLAFDTDALEHPRHPFQPFNQSHEPTPRYAAGKMEMKSASGIEATMFSPPFVDLTPKALAS